MSNKRNHPNQVLATDLTTTKHDITDANIGEDVYSDQSFPSADERKPKLNNNNRTKNDLRNAVQQSVEESDDSDVFGEIPVDNIFE